MPTQYGRNGGFTGLVDLPGLGAKFQGRFYGYQHGLGVGEKPRLGRGTLNWQGARPLFSSGTVAISGKVRKDGFPTPAPWKGQAGTITVTFDDGVTEDIPVLITAASFSKTEDKEDLHNVTLTARVTSEPTFDGFDGTQGVTEDPSRSDQEQYTGTSKTLDPQGLASGATRRTDVWGALADTDAGELNRLANIIAAAQQPFAGMKLRAATFQRDSYDGGEVLETWGLTDTAEDVVNPRTVETIDPQKLGSNASAAAINASPTTPTGDALFVKRSESTTELNDGHILHTATYARLDSKEAVEFPGTVAGDDPYDLADRGTITKVHDTSTPPADPTAPLGQLIERATTQIDRGKWQTVWTYANLNSEQRIEFPAAERATDPSGLEDVDHQSDVTSSSTVPTTPASRFTDGKLRVVRSTRVGGTPEKWLHVWEFGRRTTADDVTMPETVTSDEVSDIEDEARLCYVTSSATPPATPAAPLGQLLKIETTQLHGSNGGKWKHLFVYGNTTALQRLQFPTDHQDGDPSLLEDEDHQSDTSGSSTPPATPSPRIAGLVLRSTSSVRIAGTPEKWLHRWTFGRRTTEEDVTFPGTVTSNETSDIEDDATVTLVNASSTPPATPSAPVGQLLEVRSEQITDAGKWKHTFRFGNTTALQKIQFPTDVVATDPSLLEDEDHQSTTTGTSTPPSTPATRVSGLVLRTITSRRIAGTPEKWLHQWAFGRRSTAEDVTFPGTVTTDEVSDIADDATVTLIGTSTPPAAPAAPVGQLLETRSEQITDSGKWKHTYHYGNTTALQRVQFPTDVLETDPAALQDEDRQSQTTATSTVPAAPATRVSGLVLRTVVSRRISGTPEKWLHQWTFGRRSTAEDITFPGTVTTDEVSDVADDATVTLVTASPTAPATPIAPVGQLLEVRSEQLTDAGKWKHTFHFGNTTALQRIQFPTDVLETDPALLRDEDHQSATTATSTVPATPAPRVSGLVLRTVTSKRISGTPEKWLHQWDFGRRSTAEDETFPGTVSQDDVGDLEDHATVTLITTSGTAPSAPAAPFGQLVETRSEQLTDAGKWKHTFTYANTTSVQRAQFPNDKPDDDPQNLTDEDVQAQVTTSVTPPAAPAARPTALKLRSVSSQRIGGTPAQYLHVWRFGRRNTQEDIEFPATISDVDQYSIDGTATVRKVNSSSTPPATPAAPLGECVSIQTVQIHAGTDGERWQHTFKYAQINSQQRHTFPENVPQQDPSSLADTETQASVDTSATPPSDPAPTISGLVVRVRRTRRVSGTPAYYLHVWEFGRRTTQSDVEMPASVTTNDNADLRDRATVCQVTNSSTPPSVPAAPVGQHVATETVQLHATRWQHTFHYANNTAAQDVTFPDSPVDADPSSLSDEERIASINGSSTPPATPSPTISGVKLRRRLSRRLAGTPEQWEHVFTFARRTTQDEVEMDNSETRNDVSGLTDTAAITQVTNSGTAPTVPASPDADAVHVGTDSKQLHDTRWRHTFRYGPRTSQQAVEMDGTSTTDDPQDLSDQGEITVVTALATPPTIPAAPTGQKHRRTRSQQLKSGKWKHSFEYGETTTKEDAEFAASSSVDDPSDLKDEATVGLVTNSDVAPATPASPVAAAVFVERRIKQLTDDRWLHTFVYGPRTNQQAVEFDGTDTKDDANDIDDDARITLVTGLATPPTTPAAPVGTTLRHTEIRQLTGGKWRHTFVYGRRNTKQDIEMPATVTSDDVADLRDTATVCQVTNSATPPTAPAAPVGLLVATETVQLHGSRWKHTFSYANMTHAQAVTFPDSPIEVDPSLLSDEERVASITASSTAPATPTPTTSGLQLRRRIAKRLSGTPEKWEHIFLFARRTTEDDVEFDGSHTTEDNSDLTGSATITLVADTGSPPSTPGSPTSGVKHVKTTTRQLTLTKSAFRFEYAPRSSQDDVEMDGTVTQDDPKDLIDEARITVVLDTDTAPAPPTAPAGTKHRRTDTQQLTDGKWRHTYVYGRRDAEDDVEMPGSATTDDQSDIADSAEITVVHTSSTSPTAPAAPVGTKLVEVRVEQIHDSKWKHLFRYARKNRKDEIEMDGSAVVDDPQDLEDGRVVVQVTSSATPPAAPGGPSGTVLVTIVSKQLHDTRWQHTWRYATRSTKDEIEMPGTWQYQDPNALTSKALQTSVYLTGASLPTPVTPPGMQQVGSQFSVLNNTKSKIEYHYAVNNSRQELEFPESRTVTDPQSLEDKGTVGGVDLIPVTPTGYVDRGLRTVKITAASTLYVRQYGRTSTKDDVQFPGTFTDLDVSGLTTDGRKASVFTTGTPPADPTPPTGTKIVGYRDTQLTADVGGAAGLSRRDYRFDVATPTEKAELGATSAQVTPTESYARTTATLATVTAGDTAAALADTLFAANVSDPLFDGVEVRKLTPARALQIIKRANDDKLLRCVGSHTFEDVIKGRPPNSTWGTAGSYGAPDCVVLVSRLPGQVTGSGIGGFTRALVQPFKITRHRATYFYRRRIVTADPTSAFQAGLIGLTNNAALFGIPAHFLMFGPPILHYCFAIAGAHLLLVDYVLQYDSQMWLNDQYLFDGWLNTKVGTTIAGVGVINPNLVFDTSMILTWPPDGTLSVITS